MKTIVAGGRNYKFKKIDYLILDSAGISEVVSGCCSGADESGESWANDRGISTKKFPADWKNNGKAAGPIRNRQMAEYADQVVLFTGGKGTESMYKEAKRAGIKIVDYR